MGDSSQPDWPDDAILKAVLDETRRRVIYELDENSHGLTADSLAMDLGTERDEDFRRLQIQLHHYHLPILDETAVVQYDPDENIVKPGPRFDDALVVLSQFDDWA